MVRVETGSPSLAPSLAPSPAVTQKDNSDAFYENKIILFGAAALVGACCICLLYGCFTVLKLFVVREKKGKEQKSEEEEAYDAKTRDVERYAGSGSGSTRQEEEEEERVKGKGGDDEDEDEDEDEDDDEDSSDPGHAMSHTVKHHPPSLSSSPSPLLAALDTQTTPPPGFSAPLSRSASQRFSSLQRASSSSSMTSSRSPHLKTRLSSLDEPEGLMMTPIDTNRDKDKNEKKKEDSAGGDSRGDNLSRFASSPAMGAPKTSRHDTGAGVDRDAKGWEEKFSESKQRVYWKSLSTGKSTWKNPHDPRDPRTAAKGGGGGERWTPPPITSSPSPFPSPHLQRNNSRGRDIDRDRDRDTSEPDGKSRTDRRDGIELQEAPPLSRGLSLPPTGGRYHHEEGREEEEWEEKFSMTKQRVYWKNKTSGKSTWKNPYDSTGRAAVQLGRTLSSPSPSPSPILPPSPSPRAGMMAASRAVQSSRGAMDNTNDEGWEEKFSESKQRVYWKSLSTGKSTWKNPHDPRDPRTAAKGGGGGMLSRGHSTPQLSGPRSSSKSNSSGTSNDAPNTPSKRSKAPKAKAQFEDRSMLSL